MQEVKRNSINMEQITFNIIYIWYYLQTYNKPLASVQLLPRKAKSTVTTSNDKTLGLA